MNSCQIIGGGSRLISLGTRTPQYGFEHEGCEENLPCCDATVGRLELLINASMIRRVAVVIGPQHTVTAVLDLRCGNLVALEAIETVWTVEAIASKADNLSGFG